MSLGSIYKLPERPWVVIDNKNSHMLVVSPHARGNSHTVIARVPYANASAAALLASAPELLEFSIQALEFLVSLQSAAGLSNRKAVALEGLIRDGRMAVLMLSAAAAPEEDE